MDQKDFEEDLDSKLSRRKFINWFLNTTAGAFLLSVFYPVARYLIPPKVEESTAATVTPPIKPADVKPNSGQIFKFGNRPAILIRTPGGRAPVLLCRLHSPGLHRAVSTQPQPHLVCVPQREL